METIEKTAFNLLKNLGLNKLETKIYLYLSKTKPQKASTIAKSNKVDRVQLYKILKTLQLQQIIDSTNTYPKLYSAVPIDKVFDLSIKTKQKQVQKLRSNKKSILLQWQQLLPKSNDQSTGAFMVLEGKKFVHSKIKQLIQKSKKTVNIVTPYVGIVQSYNSGIFNIAFSHPQVDKINFKFLVSLSNVNVDWSMLIELFKRSKEVSMLAEVHVADLGSNNFPRYAIVDNKEVLFSLHPSSENLYGDENEVGLWTNNKILVNAFRAFFDSIWFTSVDLSEQLQFP